ncbi:unnamed protein product [Caenorhabditis angaria]|uniref:Histone-lysine N-methyltransferase n=1 Tax=Caenorhabditis angaria TaxID=860376 RepID=A0A9P1ITI4_9PELO|nr:unnamed protein product [Caenorhabditis angaria]
MEILTRNVNQVLWPQKIDQIRKRENIDYLAKEQGKRRENIIAINKKSVENCIICGEKSGILYSCQGFINGLIEDGENEVRKKCLSKFHFDCIRSYNSFDYNIRYISLAECQNSILCPLHNCDCCFMERRKQSAFIGELIECVSCLRSFHKDKCFPVGSKRLEVVWKLDKPYKSEMLICSAHRPKPIIKPNSHIKSCLDCENEDNSQRTLINCRFCVRSFHQECRTTQEIDHKIINTDICEYCLTGESLGINSHVLAKWKNQYYPGIVRDWKFEKIPPILKKSKFFEEIGYCLVEWYENKTFSIVLFSELISFHTSSIKILDAIKDLRMRNSVRKDFRTLKRDVDFPAILKEVGRSLETARYLKKEDEKKFVELVETEYICDCPKTRNPHCQNSNCQNIQLHYECSESCTTQQGKCKNRGISENVPQQNLAIQVLPTPEKGYGVFAKQQIFSGDFIIEYAGEILSKREVDRRNLILEIGRDREANLFMAQLSKGRVIDSAKIGNWARYINHSCEPNCRFEKRSVIVGKSGRNGILYDERIAVVAIRNIQPGEEICFKYQMKTGNASQVPICKCGSDNCEGTLGGRRENDEIVEELEEIENIPERTTANKRKSALRVVANVPKRRCPPPTTSQPLQSINIPQVFQEYIANYNGDREKMAYLRNIQENVKSLDYQKEFLNEAIGWKLDKYKSKNSGKSPSNSQLYLDNSSNPGPSRIS